MHRLQDYENDQRLENYKIVFLFSGQGSQYRGMGEKLFRTQSVFADSLRRSDALVRRHLGISLIDELYGQGNEAFDDLLITHPAIVAIELAILDLLSAHSIRPAYVSGNSLGEFAAGVAAGIWSSEMALEAAIEQAKSLVQSVAEGGMLAIMNVTELQLMPFIQKYGLHIASRNFPSHLTITGTRDALNGLQAELDHPDVQIFPLPVRFPFHSPLIESGKEGFIYHSYIAPALEQPSPVFISGLESGPLSSTIPVDYFWQVVRQPTDYQMLVKYFEIKGPCLYIDLGPSGTSANFIKYNLAAQSKSIVHPIMTPYRREDIQLQSLLEKFNLMV